MAPGPVGITVLLLLPPAIIGVVGAVKVPGPLIVHSIVAGFGALPLSSRIASGAERLPTVNVWTSPDIFFNAITLIVKVVVGSPPTQVKLAAAL